MPLLARLLGSAAYRIAFATSAAFALITLLLGMAVFTATQSLFVRQLESRVAEDSAALIAEFRDGGGNDLAYAIEQREAGSALTEMHYGLYARDGHRVLGALEAPRPPSGWSELAIGSLPAQANPARALAVDLADGSRLVVAGDRSGVARLDRTVVVLFGTAFGVAIVFGIATALLLGGYLRRRLSAISDAAEAIMAGDMAQRVPVSRRRDEFDRLAESLNAMLDRIAALLANLRQVSSDVAHDLRTPLARLRNRIEDALHQRSDPPAHREALEDALERVDDVLRLFSAILRISEVEGGGARRAFKRLDLAGLVTELCESYAPAVEDGGRQFSWRIEPAGEVEGDRELLAQAIINLLDNAQAHTPPGSSVEVEVVRTAGTVCVSVADNGPGVPEADRGRILQRFTRLEASRSAPGHGLGLNLVQAVANAHGAILTVEDNSPGLRVSLCWVGNPV